MAIALNEPDPSIEPIINCQLGFMHTPITMTRKTSMQVFIPSLLLILAAAAGEKPDAEAIEGAWVPSKAELAG